MKKTIVSLCCLSFLGCNGFQTLEAPPVAKNSEDTQKNPTPSIDLKNLDPKLLEFINKTSGDYKYATGYNIIEGYKKTGESVQPATMGVLAPAGAVLSNGEDMLKLLNEILNPRPEWSKTIEIASTPIQPGIAFAIDINTIDSIRLFSKSGEQAGYSSLIMWNPKNKSGVVALANRGLASKSLAKFLIRIHKQMNVNP